MLDGFLDVALEYAEMGYRVFPCSPGSKVPFGGSHGCLEATTDEEQIERWWDESPQANVAISTDGLVVIDIDGHDNPWLSTLGDRIEDLMGCPAAWTPTGGTHLYFRQPPTGDWRCNTKTLADAVDVRAEGGYVIAPPSNRAEGGGYRWMPDRELERDIPTLPDWVGELLLSAKESRSVRQRDETPGEPIPATQRNMTLTRLAGKMRRFGMSGKSIDGALQIINCERCQPPLEHPEVSKIAASVARYEPDEVATAAVEGRDLVAFADEEQPEPFPPRLLYPPGLLSEVMDYNLDGAFREQPILALAGALALLSTLTGRTVQDEVGTRTNLFLLSVAASGSGKERARVVNKELLYRAGGQQHVGPERAASATGIVSALVVEPALLLQFDEFGRYLRAATNPRAGAHLTEITTTLMRLFTGANSVFLGDAYADSKRNTAIDQPHAVLYGTTVPGHLYESLTAESISDGFMSRLLIFESEEEAPRPRNVASVSPPESLVEAVRSWMERGGRGNLSQEHPQPDVIGSTPEAIERLDALQMDCWEREKDKSDPYRTLWSRCVEKARKLALLHACSRRAPEIDGDAFEWGAALSVHLTRKLACVGQRWVSETPHQANCQRVMRWLHDHGGRATKRELSRAMQHLKKHDRDAVLEDLVEIHGVAVDRIETGKRPSEVVRLLD